MNAKFTIAARKKPGDPQAPTKYYAIAKSRGRVTVPELAERIGEISTVSSIDTSAVLEALLVVIPKELANGNIVELGDFGSFSLRISSEGSETPEQVTAHNITKVRPRFNPGKRLKKMVKDISFEKSSG